MWAGVGGDASAAAAVFCGWRDGAGLCLDSGCRPPGCRSRTGGWRRNGHGKRSRSVGTGDSQLLCQKDSWETAGSLVARGRRDGPGGQRPALRPSALLPALRPSALLPSVRLAFCSYFGQRLVCLLGHSLRGAT